MTITEKYIEKNRTFYKRLLMIAVPVILQSIITTGVNLVDNIMLGQLTETALSGSTQANQFIALFTYAIMGISMGSSVLASRYWGARDILSLKKVITIALRFGLILALPFSIAVLVFPDQIMTLYFQTNAAEEIAVGAEYLKWSAASFILMAISYVLTNISRSINASTVPLIASAGAFFVNIGANYVLIFGRCGFPTMGTAGAALGTLIARVVETGIVLVFFIRNKAVHYRARDLLMACGDQVMNFLKISVPVMLSDGLLGVGDNVLAMIMGQIGSNFVSANAITSVIQRVSTLFVSGLAFSSCILTGQMLGEGKVKEVRRQGYTYVFLGVIIGLIAAVIMQIVGDSVIDVYKITDETKAIAYQLIDALCIIVVFRAANSILTKGVLRGGGDTQFLLAADMSTMWLIAIPFGTLAGLVFHLPAFFTYLFLYSDQIIKAFFCAFRLHSGKWIKKFDAPQKKTQM